MEIIKPRISQELKTALEKLDTYYFIKSTNKSRRKKKKKKTC